MAAITHAGTTWNTTAGNKTVVATPAAGDLIVVVAPCTLSGGTTAVTDNNSDGLGTYTQIDTDRTGFSTAGVLTVWVRNALIGSATSTTFTAAQSGSTGGGLTVFRVSGMTRTALTNAVLSSGGQSSGTAGTTPAPVLSTTPQSGNPIIAAVCNGSNTSTTVVERTGYTEASDLGYNTPATGFESCFLNSGETSATITFGGTTATAFASVAIELDTTTAPTPGYRSSSQLSGSSTTSAAVPVPSGAAVDDIAVVALYMESAAAVTAPSGFNLKSDLATSPTARGRLLVYWKRLTAADSGTYTFSWTGATFRAAVCALYQGRVTSGDPFDGTVGTAESGATVTTLNVSTSPAAADGSAFGAWSNFNGGASWTPPGSYTERQDMPVLTLDTRDLMASGSTGSVTATASISDFMKAFLGVLAVASGGSSLTESPADTEGLSDALTVDQSKTIADNLGLIDTRTFDLGKTTSDTLGLTDAAAAALTMPRTQTDDLGLIDAVTVELITTRTVTDTLGLTDSITTQLSAVTTRDVTDTLGLTDAVALQLVATRDQSDTVTVTDSLTITLARAQAPADTETLTDSLRMDRAQVVADTEALIDTLALARAAVIGDTAALTDAVNVAITTTRTIADTLGLSDAVSMTITTETGAYLLLAGGGIEPGQLASAIEQAPWAGAVEPGPMLGAVEPGPYDTETEPGPYTTEVEP